MRGQRLVGGGMREGAISPANLPSGANLQANLLRTTLSSNFGLRGAAIHIIKCVDWCEHKYSCQYHHLTTNFVGDDAQSICSQATDKALRASQNACELSNLLLCMLLSLIDVSDHIHLHNQGLRYATNATSCVQKGFPIDRLSGKVKTPL